VGGLGVGVVIGLLGPWIGHRLVAFGNRIWPLVAAVSSSS